MCRFGGLELTKYNSGLKREKAACFKCLNNCRRNICCLAHLKISGKEVPFMNPIYTPPNTIFKCLAIVMLLWSKQANI